jgi:hypothetical protein
MFVESEETILKEDRIARADRGIATGFAEKKEQNLKLYVFKAHAS